MDAAISRQYECITHQLSRPGSARRLRRTQPGMQVTHRDSPCDTHSESHNGDLPWPKLGGKLSNLSQQQRPVSFLAAAPSASPQMEPSGPS